MFYLLTFFLNSLVEVGVVRNSLPKDMIYLQGFLRVFYGVREWSITGRGGGGATKWEAGGGGEVKF